MSFDAAYTLQASRVEVYHRQPLDLLPAIAATKTASIDEFISQTPTSG